MSSPKKVGRITKFSPPPGTIRRSNYREKSFDSLMLDFDSRCAYSMQHSKRVGDEGLQVDHFNPRKKKDPVQEYSNLFPAIAHCNNRKEDFWPDTMEEYDKGKRILNPRKEQDYDEQLVEVKETGELIGLTTAARFHILKLDLNVQFLCDERHDRTNHALLTGELGTLSSALPTNVSALASNLATETSFMIPPIKLATTSQIAAAKELGLIRS